MAIVCSRLGRRAASCLQLECCRRNAVLKPFTFNGEPLSCVELGEGTQVFRRSIPTCFPYCRSNHLLVGHAADCLVCANVRSCGQFLGFSTLPGGGTNDAAPARHVLRVPSLGDSVTEGKVLEWRVGVGSLVQEQDIVCVLVADEVKVDVRADVAGRIISLAAELGGTASVGGDLAVIERLSPEAAGEARLDPLPSAHPEKASSPDAADSKKGFCHTGEAASSAANKPTGLAGSSSRVRKPLISFRNALKRLEMLGLLPSQPQSVCASERRDKEEKVERQGPAPPGSSSVVVRYNGLEDLPPFLLRPALSPEEVEAINDGGVTNLDAAAKAWSVSMSFHPVSAAVASSKASQAKRASA